MSPRTARWWSCTGQHTGRSAADKFVVSDASTEPHVWWDNNKAMSPAHFDALYADMMAYAEGRELFAKDLFGGADLTHRIKVRIVTEYAWHSLFVHQLLIRPTAEELKGFDPEFTIIDLPSFNADPAKHGCASQTVIAVNFTKKLILIGGTSYAGEMKKSVFTILNYLLPPKRVMPMHCSANVGKDGKVGDLLRPFRHRQDHAVGRCLAHPDRRRRAWLERAWRLQFRRRLLCQGDQAFARGRAGNLLHHRTLRHGAGECGDGSRRPASSISTTRKYAENTRAAYPIDFIPNASETGRAGHPKNVIMLTADAFGVLPPISRLTPSQAMYHFLSGFTAKVAGTEKGLGKEPQPTFSTCFGAPFMPRHPSEYGNLLRDLIAPARCRLLAGQHRLDRRRLRHRHRACRSRRRARC